MKIRNEDREFNHTVDDSPDLKPQKYGHNVLETSSSLVKL